MDFWNGKNPFDEAEDLASAPSGDRSKQWLAGVVLAAVPVIYGVVCIKRGHTTFFGRTDSFDLTGDGGFWLAVAYIAVGAFLHFHYFWGLSEHLWRFSQPMKMLSLLVFLPSFFYSLVRFFV